MEQETISEVDERRKRYEKLAELLKKWIAEASPYDAIVAAELEKADDLTMRCGNDDEPTF
jgi:hypothetical protein